MTGPVDDPYVAGLADDVLRFQQCDACGHGQLPPALRCEACGGRELHAQRASGSGRVESYAVLHRGPTPFHQSRVPYRSARVQLAEGPRIITQLIADEGRWPEVGDTVQAAFVELDGVRRPVFRLGI